MIGLPPEMRSKRKGIIPVNAIRLMAVFALTCIGASAQEFRGRITGRVVDSTGGVIPGVRVKATNIETRAPVAAASNEQGIYEIPYLTPGVYDISAEREGFKHYVRSGLELRVGDVLSIDIVLQPGAVMETVTVTAETPLLEVAPSSGHVVDSRRITELPVSGGNPFVLAQLSSDVIYFGQPNHGNMAPSVEVFSNIGGAGVRSYNMEFSLDGAPSMWGAYASFSPPADMVSEFKVQINKFDASVGHAAGGTINVALRSGTNALHGALKEFHTNDKLMGLDLFQRRYVYDPSSGPPSDAKRRSVEPIQAWNLFSATAGGPVKIPGLYDGKNRTFWIYGFDGHTKVTTTVGGYYRTVPTVQQRQGDFSALLALGPNYQIYDPATITPTPEGRFRRDPFPNNVIPKSRITPMSQSFLPYWPEPNIAGSADGLNNYFRTIPEYSEYFAHMGRMDHNINDRHRIFGRYHQSHQVYDSGQYFPNIFTGSRRHRWSKGVGFDDVYVLNPEFLVNFRYSLSRFVQQTVPSSAGFDLASAGFSNNLIFVIDPQGVKFPAINITGYTALSTPVPSRESVLYHTWAGDFTKIHGSHSLRFGGEFRCYREFNYNFNNTTPSFTFGNTWTLGPLDTSASSPMGQGLAAFLLDRPSTGTIQVNASYAQQSTYTGLFLQDDFKLSPRLTINMGLRYEYESPTTERLNRSVRDFDFSASSPLETAAKAAYANAPIPQITAGQFRVPGGLQFAGGGQPRSLWNADRTNFAPRLGAAYQLSPTVVLRGGYGLFFMPMGVDRQDAIQTGFTQATTLVSTVDNGLNFVAGMANPFPSGIQQPAGASGGLLTNAGRAITFFESNRSHGYVQRWMASVQKQLPGALHTEVGYAGTHGSRLDLTREFNAVPQQYYSTLPYRDAAAINLLGTQVANPFYPRLPGTGLAARTVARSQLLRPHPQFSGITAVEPQASSSYHAAQVRLQRRMRSGFTIQASYTWSKFMEARTFLNAFDALSEHVISDQDRPQRFVASGIWELPFGRGRHFASNWKGLPGQIVSGWQLQAIYQAQSGAPLAFGNILFTGDIHDIVLPIGDRNVARWFNTEAGFEKNSAKQLGANVRAFPSRLTGLRGPGLNLWNFSTLRNFRITERVTFQLRGELLNATNHTHLSTPNNSPTSTLFGQITRSYGWPRAVYFTGKLRF